MKKDEEVLAPEGIIDSRNVGGFEGISDSRGDPAMCIRLEFDHACSFAPKANLLSHSIRDRCDRLWEEDRVHVLYEIRSAPQPSRLEVWLDEAKLYSKGPPNPSNPQPTPAEMEELIESLFPEYPLSEEETEAIQRLQSEQIAMLKGHGICS